MGIEKMECIETLLCDAIFSVMAIVFTDSPRQGESEDEKIKNNEKEVLFLFHRRGDEKKKWESIIFWRIFDK